LVGKGVQALLRIADSHLRQKLDDLRTGGTSPDTLVQRQDFSDLPFDRVERIERGHRLLEDHGDVVAAHLP
jgi:hypothetical protein